MNSRGTFNNNRNTYNNDDAYNITHNDNHDVYNEYS